MDKHIKQLWQLLNMLGILLLTTAFPAQHIEGSSSASNFWPLVSKTCLSRGACDESISVQHLKMLERNMKTSADPCNDFHDYACGNWHSPLPHLPQASMMVVADSKVTDNFVQLFERLLREKRKHFLNDSFVSREAADQPLRLPQDHGAAYEKLLKYYNVCKKSGTPTLRGYIEELTRQEIWQHSDRYNWMEGLSQVTSYGRGNVFLMFYSRQQNATYYKISVAPANFKKKVQLSSEIYEIISAFTSRSHRVLQSQFHQLEADLSAILSVACAGQVLDEQSECDLLKSYTMEDLHREAGEINWRRYLRPQLGALYDAQQFYLNVNDLASIKKIAHYLDQADSELLKLYTLTKFANYVQSLLHNNLQVGASSINCIRHMRKLFHQPMTFLYEHVFYKSQRLYSEPLIQSVFAQLKQEFARTLQNNRYQLSAPLVAFLLRKLSAMRINIGNLALSSTQFYIDYMRELNVSDDFYHNHLEALQHAYNLHRSLAALRPGYDDDSPWHTLSYHASNFPDNIDQTAYYYAENNMLILPHAYLQLPFFNHQFWPALIYGDLATTLGHELMHAFDMNFLAYDANGNFDDSYQEQLEANEHYRQHLKCLGNDNDTERFADLTGTRLALDTFMRGPQFRRDNGQVVFLQFAQFFCGGAADLASHLAVDPNHDLDRLRLNYALAHMPEFAETFQCPLGSAMHPTERCELW